MDRPGLVVALEVSRRLLIGTVRVAGGSGAVVGAASSVDSGLVRGRRGPGDGRRGRLDPDHSSGGGGSGSSGRGVVGAVADQLRAVGVGAVSAVGVASVGAPVLAGDRSGVWVERAGGGALPDMVGGGGPQARQARAAGPGAVGRPDPARRVDRSADRSGDAGGHVAAAGAGAIGAVGGGDHRGGAEAAGRGPGPFGAVRAARPVGAGPDVRGGRPAYRHPPDTRSTEPPAAGDRAVRMPVPMVSRVVRLGRAEDGTDVVVDPCDPWHAAFQGATRSGKSALTYTLLAGVAHHADVLVCGVDPSGVLLAPLGQWPGCGVDRHRHRRPHQRRRRAERAC
ncbi:MAG: hypothetical protein ACRCTR_07060 [Actinomycetota bacterium]